MASGLNREKRMKAYLGMVKTEIKRIFTVKYFIISLLLMMILIGMGNCMFFQTIGTGDCTFYNVFENTMVGGYFMELIYIPASLYAIVNLCMDINQKCYYLYSSRSGKKAYILAKFIVVYCYQSVFTYTGNGVYN